MNSEIPIVGIIIGGGIGGGGTGGGGGGGIGAGIGGSIGVGIVHKLCQQILEVIIKISSFQCRHLPENQTVLLSKYISFLSLNFKIFLGITFVT